MDALVEAVTELGAHLKCPICLSLLCNATSMPCSHTFCRDCISQAIGQKGKCPICKQESTRRNLVLNQQMTRFVTYYKQLVFNDDMGVSLSQPCTFSQVENHLSIRDFVPVVGTGSSQKPSKKRKEATPRASQLLMPSSPPMLPTASPETLPDPIAPQIPSTTESVAAAVTGTQASVAAVAEFAPNTSLPFATPCAVVLSSGLSPPDEERLLRLQSLLGPSTCDVQIAFSPAVTHLVVPARKAVAQKRSLKYIQAILSKVFIVRPEWIGACLRAKAIVDEKPFIVSGVHQDTVMGGPARALASRQPLFQFWKFALRGQYHPPHITKVDLVGLLETSGAEIVSGSDFGDSTVRCAVLCDTEPAAAKRDSPVPTLSYKWFLDCVSSFTVLPFTHKPKK